MSSAPLSLPQALPVAMRKLGPSAEGGVSLPWAAVGEALDHMAEGAANHIDKEHLLVLWECVEVREGSRL